MLNIQQSESNLPIGLGKHVVWQITTDSFVSLNCPPKMKVDDMNIRNKAAFITASVMTVSALLLASPALAHKNTTKESAKPTTKSVVATPSTSPTVAPTPPAKGDRDGRHKGRHGKGHNGKGHKGAPAPLTQMVTVDVPTTGTYQLLVTKVKPAKSPTPPPGAPARPDHSFTVAVTGTGSQTITLKLPRPGNYTVALISVVSSQSITATK